MVKIGIVGTGWVAKLHIEALKKVEGVEIAAIAGRNLERGRELTAGTGARVYGDWRGMLGKEELDGVFVLLPPHLHGELEIACAGKVRGVLIEKPIGVEMGTCERVREAFERAGTVVSVGYMNRYRKTVEKARGIFAGGEAVVLVNGWWVGGMPGPLWWRNGEQSGGQFVEQCTHVVDAARYIVGEIVEVSAIAARGFVRDVAEYSVDDAMVVNVRFENGAIGNFTTACHAPGVNEIGLRVSSRKTQCRFSGWGFDLRVGREQEPEEVVKSEEDIFLVQAKAFVKALVTGDGAGLRCGYGDAMRTLRVTLAANESARRGEWVRV